MTLKVIGVTLAQLVLELLSQAKSHIIYQAEQFQNQGLALVQNTSFLIGVIAELILFQDQYRQQRGKR
ncbi:MAG: hypothetical protein DI539_25670 [Flavobacterium psychrophilum]|nr:MAG: hypothetical protein DI539_25670 [Flavobacterium psychrophilum]